jgi:hypothetical protein
MSKDSKHDKNKSDCTPSHDQGSADLQTALTQADDDRHDRDQEAADADQARTLETTIEAEAADMDHAQIHDFVQDDFFKKGHVWLKFRQLALNLVFLAVLVVPVLILFNSLTSGNLIDKLYFWTYSDGFDLTKYLQSAILLAIVFILVCSLAFLFRNNYRQQKVLPTRPTYDAEKMAERKAVLEKMYSERFGPQEMRERAKYYEVEGEQNIPDDMIHKLFKDGGVEIK